MGIAPPLKCPLVVMLWISHQKNYSFLHYVTVTAGKCTIVPVQRKILRRQKSQKGIPSKHYRDLFVCNQHRSAMLYIAQNADGTYSGTTTNQDGGRDLLWLLANSHGWSFLFVQQIDHFSITLAQRTTHWTATSLRCIRGKHCGLRECHGHVHACKTAFFVFSADRVCSSVTMTALMISSSDCGLRQPVRQVIWTTLYTVWCCPC